MYFSKSEHPFPLDVPRPGLLRFRALRFSVASVVRAICTTYSTTCLCESGAAVLHPLGAQIVEGNTREATQKQALLLETNLFLFLETTHTETQTNTQRK